MAFPVGWLRQCPLVIQHSKVPADQTAFPVLLTEATLPGEMMTTGGGNAAQADGGDIRFSTDIAGASQLACEIVVWTQNANPLLAKAEIWVPVSVLTAVDVTIYVWYSAGGGQTQPAAGAAFGSQAVWDANYKGVYHLPNGSSLTVNDSTSNAANGTNHGITATAGQIDGGGNHDGTTTKNIQLPNSTLASTNNFTASGWGNLNSNAAFQAMWTDQSTLRFLGANATGRGYSQVSGGNTIISSAPSISGGWHYLVMVKSSTAGLSIYVDAVATTNAASTAATTANAVQGIGADPGLNQFPWRGDLDEIRLSSSVRSATWITTEYNNQLTPSTFVVAGSPSTPGGGSLSLFRPSTLSGLGSGGPFFQNPLN